MLYEIGQSRLHFHLALRFNTLVHKKFEIDLFTRINKIIRQKFRYAESDIQVIRSDVRLLKKSIYGRKKSMPTIPKSLEVLIFQIFDTRITIFTNIGKNFCHMNEISSLVFTYSTLMLRY